MDYKMGISWSGNLGMIWKSPSLKQLASKLWYSKQISLHRTIIVVTIHFPVYEHKFCLQIKNSMFTTFPEPDSRFSKQIELKPSQNHFNMWQKFCGNFSSSTSFPVLESLFALIDKYDSRSAARVYRLSYVSLFCFSNDSFNRDNSWKGVKEQSTISQQTYW